MSKMEWVLKTNPLYEEEGLSHSKKTRGKVEIPSLIYQILANRGLSDDKSIQNWLSPKLSNLRSPFLIKDMDLAVERLLRARQDDEKICIYGDFDLDGTPGVALLLRGLSLLGFKSLCYYQPKRLSEGYGFHFHAVEKFKKEEVDLVLTVDVGITDIETVAKAKQIGMDVIITDHHLPKAGLPEAVAVLNPNREDCESGLGHLCGTGVAFFLILALRNNLRESNLLENDFNPKELLDVFAIATLTDMVPLVAENRVLVKHGILELEKTKRPGLKLLLKELGLLGRPLTGGDVAIRFSPKLNALSRMEMEILPIDVFLVETEKEAEKLITDVLEKNQMRIQLQKNAEQDALKSIGEKCLDSFVWVYSDHYHKGVVGLVATKMAQKYGVPAFVGSCNEQGVITGSARAPDGEDWNLVEILGEAKESLLHFGGHVSASGFSLNKDQAEQFNQLLKNALMDRQNSSDIVARLEFDTVMDLSDLDSSFMNWYESLGPFGVGFEAPIFCFQSLTVVSVRELNGGHLKLKVKDDHGYSLDALWFSPDLNHPLLKGGLRDGLIVDILGEPQWNYFAGRKSLQLLLRDIRLKKEMQKVNYSVEREVLIDG